MKRILSQNKEDVIRRRFIAALKDDASHCEAIRTVIEDADDNDIDRIELVTWGVEAGFSLSYVRATISSVLIRCGKRIRKTGAGRKPPKEAVRLAKQAKKKFGVQATSVLLAAYRYLKAHR